jgi:hypothetical protein
MHFPAAVLHAAHERRPQKVEAVETITFVHRCPTALSSPFIPAILSRAHDTTAMGQLAEWSVAGPLRPMRDGWLGERGCRSNRSYAARIAPRLRMGTG